MIYSPPLQPFRRIITSPLAPVLPPQAHPFPTPPCFRIRKGISTGCLLSQIPLKQRASVRRADAYQITMETKAEAPRGQLFLRGPSKGQAMKYAGLLVMPAGFFLTIAALLLFPAPLSRAVFVFCGLAVEALGLAVAVRGHMGPREETRP